MKIFLDMDGVLADFVSGICRAHGRENPFAHGMNHGVYNMAHLWSMTLTEFFAPANYLFWNSLEPTEEARSIVDIAIGAVGSKNVCILSSPSLNDGCVPGKRDWIRRHFPELSRNTLFGSRKDFCASGSSVLIDDHDSNILDFERAGGRGFLLPRPWNSAHNDTVPTFLKRLGITFASHKEY